MEAPWLDGGVGKTLTTPDDLWSPLFAAQCLTSQGLDSLSCLSVQAEVWATFSIDGGFSYGTNSGFTPPPEFVQASTSVFSLCAPFFRSWDGGVYPYRY